MLLIFLSFSISGSWINRIAFGSITIEKHDIETTNGRIVSFRVYKPSFNTYGQPLPAVLTIHGISSSGLMMDSFNIELARRNFTVVSLDTAGHGRSSERFSFGSLFDSVMDAFEAVRYIQLSDPDTDDSHYGILGHSLGAGISLLFDNVTVQPSATVIIGGGMGDQFGGLTLPLNESAPRNLMIASGLYDELVPQILAIETLKIATGIMEPEVGTTYGNFTEGTARKLVFSATNHLFEISDAKIVSESIDWLGRALHGEQYAEESMLNPNQLIYQFVSGFDLLASVSFVFTIFLLVLITYSRLPARFKPDRIQDIPEALETNSAVRFSIILGIITSVLFLLLMLFGFIFEFTGVVLIPVSFGTSLSLISVLSCLVIIAISRRYLGKDKVQSFMIEVTSGKRHLLKNMFCALILLLPILFWILMVSFIVRIGLDNPLVFTFAVDSGAILFRFIYLLALVILMLPIFYADTLWLNISVGIVAGWNNPSNLVRKTGQALINRLLGMVIIIGLLYLPFLAGLQLGFIMFIALLMLPFMVLLGVTVLVTVWIGGITRSNISPALMNAALFALVISSTFQLI